MAKRRGVDENELKALIASEIADAELFDPVFTSSADNGNIKYTSREMAMNYYNGVMPDTPAAPGWSTFKSRDVADVMGWVLPGIIRVFTASDRMVDYEARTPGDEAFVDQASDYANYVFWVDNDGYRVLWDATHDSLLMGDGIVKSWWDDSKTYEMRVYTGLPAEAIAMLQQDDDVEIVEAKPCDDNEAVDELGEPEEPTWDVKIKRTTSYGRLKCEAIEPENFLKDRSSITIQGARFCAHRDPHMTRSGLIEMGFSKKLVESIPRYEDPQDFGGLGIARQDDNTFDSSSGDKSMDRVTLYECYIRKDINGDGIAETILAYYAGNSGPGILLDWEEWDDEIPFDQIPCDPVPHRFESRSLAGEVMDIQRIKTVLLRGMLDNSYQVQMPRPVFESGDVLNMDEINNPTIGGAIIMKKGATPLTWHVTPSTMEATLGALATMDQITEMRTGVSRSTQALDPEALTNQTATAVQSQKDSAYSQIELIARNMAELGWKSVFSKFLRIIVKHQDKPRTIRLRDQWVPIDPRVWNANMDAVINVGLGSGSRDRDMAILGNIAMQQKELIAGFQANGLSDLALETTQKLLKTEVKMTESAGIRNATSFWPELDDEKMQAIQQQQAEAAKQPDPEVQAAQAELQAKMQMQQAEMQAKQHLAQAEMQMKAQQSQQDNALKAQENEQKNARELQQMQLKYQLDRENMAAELQLKRETTQAELNLKREQLNAELAMSQQQWQAEFELQKAQAAANAENQTKIADAKASSSVHVGGEPG